MKTMTLLLAAALLAKTNWEGTGVQPDIKTPAAEALSQARREALNHLISKADSNGRKQLERLRDAPPSGQ